MLNWRSTVLSQSTTPFVLHELDELRHLGFGVHIGIFGGDFTVNGYFQVSAGDVLLTGIVPPLHLRQKDVVAARHLYLWPQIDECHETVLAVGLHLALLVVVVLPLLGDGEFQIVGDGPSDDGIRIVLLLGDSLLLADELVVLPRLVGEAGLRLRFQIFVLTRCSQYFR